MKQKRFYFAVIVALFASPALALDLQLAKGWRLPTKADETGDWVDLAKKGIQTYRIRADFNGDGTPDDAYIAMKTQGNTWGLFVNLNFAKGNSQIIKLEETLAKDGAAQAMGLEVAKPGQYKTACGKGYWECKKGELPMLDLKNSGIDYYRFESANSYFWWDVKTKKFKQTWMSD